MNRGFIVLIMVVAVFAACTSNAPKYRLSPEQFRLVMFDLELANESVNTVHVLVRDSVLDIFTRRIAEQHGLSKDELIDEIMHRMKSRENLDDDYEYVKNVADSLYKPIQQ